MKTCKGCKHYKKDERIGIIVCEFGLHESYCEKDKEDFAIAEIKKIKDEILNLGFTGWADKPKLDREEVLTILDKYISELSGDNKQSRCNNCLNNTDELSGECYECVKGIEDWYEPISELKGENNADSN